MKLRDIAYQLERPNPSYDDFTQEEKDAVETYRFEKKIQDIRSEIDPMKLVEDIEELALWFDLTDTLSKIYNFRFGIYQDEKLCPGRALARKEFDTYLVRHLHDPNKNIAQAALLALREQRALSRILTPPWAFAPHLLSKVYVRLTDEMELLPLYRFSAIEEVREYVWEQLKKAVSEEPCLDLFEDKRTELRANTLYEIASDPEDQNSDEAWILLSLIADENVAAVKEQAEFHSRNAAEYATRLTTSCALETGREVG